MDAKPDSGHVCEMCLGSKRLPDTLVTGADAAWSIDLHDDEEYTVTIVWYRPDADSFQDVIRVTETMVGGAILWYLWKWNDADLPPGMGDDPLNVYIEIGHVMRANLAHSLPRTVDKKVTFHQAGMSLFRAGWIRSNHPKADAV